MAALTGGGLKVKPGEVSLAHLGVLFLDELPEFQRAVMSAVDRVNAQLSVIEKVRRVMIADAPFTVENEQMTPSMKIRRHVLRQVYGERLNALYSG